MQMTTREADVARLMKGVLPIYNVLKEEWGGITESSGEFSQPFAHFFCTPLENCAVDSDWGLQKVGYSPTSGSMSFLSGIG